MVGIRHGYRYIKYCFRLGGRRESQGLRQVFAALIEKGVSAINGRIVTIVVVKHKA